MRLRSLSCSSLLRTALILAGLTGAPLPAQGITASAAPRVAVVLSGGGAKGIAHIGVLQVLEEEGISPQIVTGTSMGALVGGLYAMGYSPAALDSLVKRLDWPSYFSDATDYHFLGIERRRIGDRTLLSVPMQHWRPSLPSGAINGQRISRLLSTLTWPAQTTRDFHALPRDFTAVATDIETGRAVVLDHGSLALALRASMSLPSVFEPVALDGQLLVDGGIARNLPATDAKERGAEVIICSDVADPLARADRLRSLADVLMQTITFQMNASTEAQRKLCDVYIRPDITGLTAADFGKAASIVDRGTVAANAVREQLRALRVARRGADSLVRHAPWPDSIRAGRIILEGLTGRPALRARRALELREGQWYTAASLDSAMQRAYATELYDRVQYRLDAAGADTSIVISAVTHTIDRAGFGFRFDDTYKAALLFSAVLRNRIGSGSTTELELRLGEQLKVGVEHISTSVQNPRFVLGGGTSVIRVPAPLYANGQRVAEVTLTVGALHAFTAAKFGRHAGLGLDVSAEASSAATAIAQQDSSRTDEFGAVAAIFQWERLDRPTYPRRGASIYLRSEYAAGSTRFMQHLARARIVWPLTHRLSLVTDGAAGGGTRGDDVPPQRRFQLGGAYPGVLLAEHQVPFVGVRPAELLGTSMVRAGATLQWEVRRDLFASARTNVGYAGEVLTLDRRLYTRGVGIAVGSLTPFGQVEIMASGQDRRGGTRVELNIGRMF